MSVSRKCANGEEVNKKLVHYNEIRDAKQHLALLALLQKE